MNLVFQIIGNISFPLHHEVCEHLSLYHRYECLLKPVHFGPLYSVLVAQEAQHLEHLEVYLIVLYCQQFLQIGRLHNLHQNLDERLFLILLQQQEKV